MLALALPLAAALAALWYHLVRALFPLAGARPELLWARTDDGWALPVWRRPARRRRFREPVLLCHGLGNNAAIMDLEPPWSLAAALSAAGFDCYAVDLRGAGPSAPPDEGPWDATVDEHVALDAPALARFVAAHAGAPAVLWLGHSLGGLVGLFAAAGPAREAVRAVVTVGSPLFFRLPRAVAWVAEAARFLAPAGRFAAPWLAVAAAPFPGRVEVAGAELSVNPRNMAPRALRLLLANTIAPLWRGVLGQLADWVRRDELRSVDGAVDYRAQAAALQLPVLVVGGSRDFLAPEAATRACFEALRTPDKHLALFGQAYGHAEDYGHGDLVAGARCETEVFPAVAAWLAARASPAGEETPAP